MCTLQKGSASFCKPLDKMEIYDDDMRFKERLIENVKKYPNLYISSRKDHWNRKLTKNCWKKISSDLKVYEKSADDCKKTFKSLRDYYFKRRKMIISSGAEVSEGKSWPFYNSLEFLADLPETEDSPSVVPKMETCLDNHKSHTDININETIDNIRDERKQSDESSYFVPILPALPIKNKMASLKRKCLEPVESIHEAKSGKGLEADSSEEETFGRAVTAQLKKLHPALKARAMFGIQQVLYEQQQEQFQIVELEPSSY